MTVGGAATAAALLNTLVDRSGAGGSGRAQGPEGPAKGAGDPEGAA
ncbi:hypothetical protein [Streptomyces sp. CA-132043]